LIAIQDALELESVVFIRAFFNAKELPMLPLAIDESRGGLSGSKDDFPGFTLLVGAGRAEVDAAIEPGD
jgi:hypothetical protein